jgi:hypothetical protein
MGAIHLSVMFHEHFHLLLLLFFKLKEHEKGNYKFLVARGKLRA